jgi:hypothetical protein
MGDHDLERLRHAADPLADDTITALMGPWSEQADANLERLAALNRAIASWQTNADVTDWQPPAGTPAIVAVTLRAYLAAARELPTWADPARIARAEQLFFEQGVLSCTLLFCASLPECYVLPDLADVLHTTGQLEQRTEHRIRSTAAMIFPVMMEGGLTTPGGGGVAQVMKVRLIHAMIRHLILHDSPAAAAASCKCIAATPLPENRRAAMHEALMARGWDVATLGMPCNQLEMAYTLLTFGFVYVRGMRTLGLPLSAADADAVMHTWNVVGHLVGIPHSEMSQDAAHAAPRFARMQALGRRRIPTPDPRPPLARALMQTMAGVLRLRILQPLPVLLTRLLCGRAARDDLRLNDRVGWLARTLFMTGLGLVRAVDAVGRLFAPDFSIARLITRLVGYQLLTKLLLDQTRPLVLPERLLPQRNATLAAWSADPRAPSWVNRVERWVTATDTWRPT